MRTKILPSFAIFFCIAIASNAQINKGRYLLGGSFSYYSASNLSNKSLYTNIQSGRIIKDNTIVGLTGSYASNNFNTTPWQDKTQQYSIGIFYRKYKALTNKFYF